MTAPELTQSGRLGRQAWDSMKSKNIPATPENYAIWYHYHAGGNPELTKAIDILEDNKRDFDAALLDELNQQFIGTGGAEETMANASQELQTVVDGVITTVATASKGAGAFGSALEVFSGNMHELDEHDIKGLVAGIMAETKKIETQNQQRSLNSMM